MKAGAFDAIATILLNGKRSSVLMELETTVNVKPVEFDRDLLNAVQKDQPGALLNTVSPAGWPSLTAEALSPAMSGILGSRPEIDNETGYTLVKTIYESSDDIRKISTELEMVTIEHATRFLLPGFPVNGGAAKYFKEKGVWRDELQIRA